MSKYHDPSIGGSDDWYTPPEFFAQLKMTFDLDPCSPGSNHWVPARRVFTIADDGLSKHWLGTVFMNPPFGGRHGHVPWLKKFLDHGDGIAIVRAYTSADWWHDYMDDAEVICFPKGKTRFIPSESLRRELEAKAAAKGKAWHNAPGFGVAVIGMGKPSCAALLTSGLGMTWDKRKEKAA